MKSLIQKLTALILMAYLLTACSQSKSSNTISSNGINITSQSVLANCTKSVNSNISVSLATIKDQVSQVDPLWIKLKFNVVNSSLTKSGMTIRFFRMKGALNDAVLDSVALQSQTYNMSTGQPSSNLSPVVNPSQINSNSGFFIYLNDAQGQYQILKIAFYDTDGKVIENFNILIPEFLANPSEYTVNSDGSARSQYLQELHPLNGVATTGWSNDTFNQFFQQFCF
jgi:hypothetical protein